MYTDHMLARRSAARSFLADGLTFVSLCAFGALGALIKTASRVALPGAVIGLALLAATLIAIDSWNGRIARRLRDGMTRLSYHVLAHMGVLFIPAGVGIVTQGSTMQREGIGLATGVVVSVTIGLTVTYLTMRVLAPHPDA
jgi:holin-like protein